MSSSQAIDQNHKDEEEKNKNSLFQTELVNPKISTLEETENKPEKEIEDSNKQITEDNNANNDLKNEDGESTDLTNQNKDTNQETKIESDPLNDIINIDSKQDSNQLPSPSKNEEDLNQNDQNQDLPEVIISISTQLTQDEEKSSPQSKKEENRPKTTNTNRNRYKNKRYSYLQEINSIPDSVKYNKYVENRYELYTGVKKAPKIPKAALSKKDYNSKEIPQLDELTLKLLEGDKEMIKKIKNSRKINPNLNETTTTTTKSNNNKKKIQNSAKKSDNNNNAKSDNNNNDKSDNNSNEKSDNINNEKSDTINNENEQTEISNIDEELKENPITQEEENKYNDIDDVDDNDDDDDNLPTIDDLKRTASQLREYEREMTSRGNYADAKNASNTLKMVNKEIYKQQVFSKNKGSIEQLVSKRNELKALLNSTTEEFDNMIIDHEQNTINKLDEIALQQQQELEEFDKNIPKDLPPLFKRNSVSYLKMRSKEKYLAITKNFDEAMNLQKKADVIEKEEEQLNFEKMDSYYREKRNKLIIKQRNAIENYIQYSDMRKGEMLNLREVAIRGTTNRIKNLELQIRMECNKRGIKQSEINYDIVDNDRIELIKSKENENPISYKRAVNSKCQKRKTQHNSTASTSASLSKRNSVTNSQSSLSSINSQSKRKSSLSSNKPVIKTPSSLSNSPLSSSVGSKKPNKPKKTAINVIQNDKRPISPLNVNSLNDNDDAISEEIENQNQNQKAEIGVNTKLEDELKINAQILNNEIDVNSPKKD